MVTWSSHQASMKKEVGLRRRVKIDPTDGIQPLPAAFSSSAPSSKSTSAHDRALASPRTIISFPLDATAALPGAKQ